MDATETAAPRSRRARPAKAPLSLAAVVATGLEILEAEGLGAVTMRRVAQALDTGPASLYVYVANSRELHRALLDSVIGQVPIPEPDPARWREQLLTLMTDGLATLDRYPGIARVAIADIPTGTNGLRIVESFLALLRAGGVPDATASWGADVLSLYITGAAFENSIYAERKWSTAEQAEYHESVHRVFRDLSPAEFPNLTQVLPWMTSGTSAERFRFGLDVLLNGLLTTPAPTAGEQPVAGAPEPE
jgi:AcrR family transcriptional regulator